VKSSELNLQEFSELIEMRNQRRQEELEKLLSINKNKTEKIIKIN